MKRIFGLFLAFILLMSSFGTVVFADENKTLQLYEKETEILKELDILNFTDYTAKMTKVEFLEVLYGLYFDETPQDVYGEAGIVLPYSDVKKDSVYYYTVCFAYQKGIIGEMPGRRFNPSKYITVNECVEILVKLCGYTVDEMSDAKSFKRKLLNSVKARGTDEVNKDICSKILFEALISDTLEKMPSVDGVNYIKKGGNSLLKVAKGISHNRGIISATPYNSLDQNNGNGRYIRINGEDLLCNNAARYVKYTGYRVLYFYTEKNGLKELIYAVPREIDNEIKVITSENITRVANGKIYYGEGTSNRIKVLNIVPKASVLYNYALYNNTDDSVFDIADGEIVFIDNNTDGKYDVASIVNYETYVVYTVDKTQKVIIDKYNSGRKISYEADSENVLVSLEDATGNSIDISRITDGTVISAIVSKEQDVIRLIAKKEYISGEVTGINKDKETVSVGDVEYKLCPGYDNSGAPVIEIGVSGNFYLDAFGRVAVYENATGLYKYGCLIDCVVTDNFDKTLAAKILTYENEVKVFNLKNGVIIDGIKYRSGNPIPDVMKKNPQLIYYYTNADGVITKIKTSHLEENETVIRQLGASNTYTYLREGTFAGYHEVTASAVIFKCPDKNGNVSDKDYKVINRTGLTKVMSYGVKAYTTGGNSFIADAFVVEDTPTSNGVISTSPVRLVKEVGTEIIDGEVVYYISLFGGASTEEEVYTFRDEELVESSGVKEGDVIKYAIDSEQQIRDIMIMYSVETGDYIAENASHGAGAGVYDATRVVYGDAVVREGNYLGITRPDTSLNNITHDSLEYFDIGPSQVYIVDLDSRTERIRKGDVSEIKDYMHYGEECSRIVIHSTNAWFSFCVVYV